MRVALLGSAGCIHSTRWANGYADHGLDVHLISAHEATLPLRNGVTLHRLPHAPPHGYLTNRNALRRILAELRPDVLNSHYASGYGTLGRLAAYRPTVVSVWGSDVFDFPKKSWLHRQLVGTNLAAAEAVCSISHVMAKQCRSLTDKIKHLEVVPWGVDTQLFSPPTAQHSSDEIVIGTVKKLHPKYGVDTLIRGFAKLRESLQARVGSEGPSLRLRLVGDGPQRAELIALSEKLGVESVCDFIPAVDHERVPEELAKLDIYVAVSRWDSESFGVAIVEAMACERPVVVSDAGGLPEVVRQGETGLVVPRENPTALADALLSLIDSPEKQSQFGLAGRRDVTERFRWEHNVAHKIGFLASVAEAAATRRIAA